MSSRTSLRAKQSSATSQRRRWLAPRVTLKRSPCGPDRASRSPGSHDQRRRSWLSSCRVCEPSRPDGDGDDQRFERESSPIVHLNSLYRVPGALPRLRYRRICAVVKQNQGPRALQTHRLGRDPGGSVAWSFARIPSQRAPERFARCPTWLFLAGAGPGPDRPPGSGPAVLNVPPPSSMREPAGRGDRSSHRELLGNFPQTLSHIGLVNAAWAISESQRLAQPT
jgi:hypothetical protein